MNIYTEILATSRLGVVFFLTDSPMEKELPMTKSLLSNPTDVPQTSAVAKTPTAQLPNREPLKHLLIGSPKGVRSAIHTLHRLGYAEVGAWSPLMPTANPDEVMSILMRYILRD